MTHDVSPVGREAYLPYLLDIHYAGRAPSVSYAFGLFREGDLVGVVTYGKPATRNARIGVCGPEYEGEVLELNRLVLKDNLKNEASMLVSRSLKMLPGPHVIVSFADTSQEHVGTIYQATNFLYTGLSAKRTDYAIDGDTSTHNMTICDRYRGQPNRVKVMRADFGDRLTLVERSRKHRYVTFIGSKGFRARALKALRYAQQPYPKASTPNQLAA